MKNKQYIVLALVGFFAARIESTGISIGAVDSDENQDIDVYECNRKADGTSCKCEDGSSGACQNEECNCASADNSNNITGQTEADEQL
jgi:hypothetical protein